MATKKVTPATEKKPVEKKVFVPMYTAKKANPRGYTPLSPEMVVQVFEAKKTGKKNSELATHFNISESSVGTILSGPAWFKDRMVKYGRVTDPKWSYPEKIVKVKKEPVKAPEKAVKPVAKPGVKKAGSVKAQSHKPAEHK